MKKMVAALVVIFAVALVGEFIFSEMSNPKTVTCDLDPSDVAKIIIVDGEDGTEYNITDREDIGRIVSDLNDITFTRDQSAVGLQAYVMATTFYDNQGEPLWGCIIQSSTMIRKYSFLYICAQPGINFEFFKTLISEMAVS